jgi:hypothetical protein
MTYRPGGWLGRLFVSEAPVEIREATLWLYCLCRQAGGLIVQGLAPITDAVIVPTILPDGSLEPVLARVRQR